MLRVEEEILTVALLADWVTGDVTDTDSLKAVIVDSKIPTVDVFCAASEATNTAAENNTP